MSKFSTIAKIIKSSAPIAEAFLPGSAGGILDKVVKGIDSPKVDNGVVIKGMAADIENLTAAVLAMNERLEKVENSR